jgi:hypothetical protein
MNFGLDELSAEGLSAVISETKAWITKKQDAKDPDLLYLNIGLTTACCKWHLN